MPDIFLSYNREDQDVARRFAEAFEGQGFSVWWDTTLRAGEAYDEVTENALNEAKAVVVLWSPRSAASRWVRAEATQADQNKTLIPATIEPCKRPIMFELTQTAELAHWRGEPADKAWLAFLADVKRFVEGGSLDAPAARAPVPAQPGGLSVCVLPFANMSGDPEQEYFADGLSEDIITDLSKVSALAVISRNSAFTFKGRHVDLPQVARQLNVTHVLEGSVRKAGNRVRITAQLIDGASNDHVWAERYDRELDDIFALQDEIAQSIVAALKLKLAPAEKKAIADRGTSSVEAYDKYLRARALQLTAGPAELTRATQIYREVLALDPEFALACYGLYAALAESMVHVPEASIEAAKEMQEVGARIVTLAPDSWWTQSMRAREFARQFKWSEADAAASAAVASAPAAVEALVNCSTVLGSLGRLGEAIECLQRARLADPLSLGVSGLLQFMLGNDGRPEEAQAEYDRSKDLSGGRALWEFLALHRLWSRPDADSAAVLAQFRLFLRHENLPLPLNHVLAGVLDDVEAARRAIRQAFEDPASQDSSRLWVIALYADRYGDKDLVLSALNRCRELKTSFVYGFWTPFQTGVRQDPRFKQIVRDLGLYDYWRASGKWADFARPVGDDDFEIVR